MDHAFIDREQIVDRYLLGTLSEDQVESFERHYFNCPSCLDRLEAARLAHRQSRRGKTTAPGLAPRTRPRRVASNPSDRSPRSGRILRWLRGPRFSLVAGLLLVLLGPAALVLRSSDSKAAEIETNPVLLELSPSRAILPQTPGIRIAPPPESRTVVLTLLLGQADFPRYGVTFRGPSGDPIWRGEDLVPNHRSALSLTLPGALLRPGDYSLGVEGLPTVGDPVPLEHYRFRVEDGPSARRRTG